MTIKIISDIDVFLILMYLIRLNVFADVNWTCSADGTMYLEWNQICWLKWLSALSEYLCSDSEWANLSADLKPTEHVFHLLWKDWGQRASKTSENRVAAVCCTGLAERRHRECQLSANVHRADKTKTGMKAKSLQENTHCWSTQVYKVNIFPI